MFVHTDNFTELSRCLHDMFFCIFQFFKVIIIEKYTIFNMCFDFVVIKPQSSPYLTIRMDLHWTILAKYLLVSW